jgi:pimeloyl-ACP methyl ester carboxylesterase
MIQARTIVFITGAFVHNSCWDAWQDYFQRLGYSTIAPSWPHKNATVEELRSRHPNHDKDLALLTLKELKQHYIKIINSLSEKPIVIGHSYGGMLVQILVNLDLADAGVAIHSVPPLGVFPYEFAFLKAGWKSLGIFTSIDETYLMSFEDWQYAFVNGMPLKEQEKAFDRYVIPESMTVSRDTLSQEAKIDFNKEHAPLLITAGDADHIIPAHLNNRNFKTYRKNQSVVNYKLFPNRNHFVLGLPTWREVAAFIADWIENN